MCSLYIELRIARADNADMRLTLANARVKSQQLQVEMLEQKELVKVNDLFSPNLNLNIPARCIGQPSTSIIYDFVWAEIRRRCGRSSK